MNDENPVSDSNTGPRSIRFDRVAQVVWFSSCLFLAIFFFVKPHLLDPEAIKQGILSYGTTAIYLYFLISMVRGFFLLPSTPLVLAGVAMYPDQPLLVIGISMLGILFSATLLYFFSEKLGFSKYLEGRHPQSISTTKARLSGSKATLFVALWSFFPLVPTDIICYAAGVIKMPFAKMMTGLFIGELVLVSLYVYMGEGILQLF